MPSSSTAKATLFRLAKHYKKHGRMPEGMGKASDAVKRIARETSMATINEFTHVQGQRKAARTHKSLMERD